MQRILEFFTALFVHNSISLSDNLRFFGDGCAHGGRDFGRLWGARSARRDLPERLLREEEGFVDRPRELRGQRPDGLLAGGRDAGEAGHHRRGARAEVGLQLGDRHRDTLQRRLVLGADRLDALYERDPRFREAGCRCARNIDGDVQDCRVTVVGHWLPSLSMAGPPPNPLAMRARPVAGARVADRSCAALPRPDGMLRKTHDGSLGKRSRPRRAAAAAPTPEV